MKNNTSKPVNLVKVKGTQLLASDTREQYRQKLARITLDSMVQFVGLLDANGTVLEINQVALDGGGLLLSEVEGKPFWHTFWWQVSEEINTELKESIQRASRGEFVRWDTEIYGRASGKETIIIDASLCPVTDDDGNVVFITAEGRDITEKKAHEREIARQREELAKLDVLKTQFFANISHEFRTPLTLMLGPLEDLLASAGIPTHAQESLHVAHRNSLRLLRLVNTLLDFSRIEAGRVHASFEPTDLAKLTTDLASTFRSAMEKAGLQLMVECPPLSQPVHVDREMWEKVVLNLLSNALKYTFRGSVTVRLENVDGRAVLSVIDTGTGIPASELPHIFERFHRVEGARGRTVEGSGIGLALVAELLKLHQGTVDVESRLGEGSTFTASVPLGTAHLPADRIGAAPSSTAVRAESYLEEALRWVPQGSAPLQAAKGASPELPSDAPLNQSPEPRDVVGRVLVADDNADMLGYVSGLLAHYYQVETATNGAQALRSATEKPPDLVLTDVMMPELDGFGLLQALRANPRTRSIPVVLLSARAGEESRSEGMDAGADDYLVKPFSARELLARVGAHLRLARTRKEVEEGRRQTEERLALALEAGGGVGTWDWDVPNDLLYADSKFAALFSIDPPHAANGMSIADYVSKIHPDDRPRVSARIQEALEGGTNYLEEYRVVQPDGSERWLQARGKSHRDDSGRPVRFPGVAFDISERKKLEEILRDSERQFRTLAESIPQLAWIADQAGNIFWYNQRWYDYTGTTLDQMQGWGWETVHDPAILPTVMERWKNALASGDAFEMVFPLRGANGDFRSFLTLVEPVRDNRGRVVRWFGTNTDITDQKKIEQDLRHANTDLQQFAFAAAHDLQEPLRMVTSYTQLLSRKLANTLDEDGRQYMNHVVGGSKRMSALLHDLLAYTEASRDQDGDRTAVDLNSVLTNVLSNLQERIRESGAMVETEPLPTVLGNEMHFTQLFQNLVSNSLKYRSKSAPNVHISASRNVREWTIQFKDNGIGIPPEHQQRVFGVFKRLHGKEIPGTGIGLAICQRVVERHGGRLWVESKGKGHGSTFCFTLPVMRNGEVQ